MSEQTSLQVDEMRSFFDRLVTVVVGHSEQAKAIETLSTQIADLNRQLQELREHNTRLEQTTHEAEVARQQAEQAKADAERRTADAEAAKTALQEAISYRDQQVTELTNSVNHLSTENAQLRRDHEMEVVKTGRLEDEANYWRNRALTAEDKGSQLQREHSMLQADHDGALRQVELWKEKHQEVSDALNVASERIARVKEALNHVTENVVRFEAAAS